MLLFDRAVDECYALAGVGEHYVKTRRASLFAAEAHVVYRRELQLGEMVRVTLQLVDVDDKRVHYVMEMRHAHEGWLAASSENLSLHVDMKTRRVVPFPRRHSLEPGLDEGGPFAPCCARLCGKGHFHAPFALQRPEHRNTTLRQRPREIARSALSFVKTDRWSHAAGRGGYCAALRRAGRLRRNSEGRVKRTARCAARQPSNSSTKRQTQGSCSRWWVRSPIGSRSSGSARRQSRARAPRDRRAWRPRRAGRHGRARTPGRHGCSPAARPAPPRGRGAA